MKKLTVLIGALLTSVGAFAYYGEYGYSSYHRDSEMSGFAIFTLIVMIVYIVLSFIVLVRWFKMTSNIQKLTDHVTAANPKITYLVAIGEMELAKKSALKLMVDKLWPFYTDAYIRDKAYQMNFIIQEQLPNIERLGIELPDYVKSGEKFIDYMNNLSGSKVPYKATQDSSMASY